MYKVAFYPYESKDNEYVNITKRVIEKQGIELVDFEEALDSKTLDEVDAFYLNWYENARLDRLVSRYLTLCKYKKKNKKIYFVMHNKRPHDGRLLKVRVFIRDLMLKVSDKIIILSEESKLYLPEDCIEKAVVIPHPNYVNVYSKYIDSNKGRCNNTQELKMLFMGQVREYKNIEMIITCFKKLREHYNNISLTIAGKTLVSKYGDKLKALIGDEKNIKTDFRFLSDEEIAELMRTHDILVLPYELKSSLNSGTVILAFSFGKTVIVPQIGTISEFDSDLTYSYKYESKEEHEKKLYEQMEKVVMDYSENNKILEEKGKSLYAIVQEKNSEEAISKLYEKLFK